MARPGHSNESESTSEFSEIYRDEYLVIRAETSGSQIHIHRSNVLHPSPAELERSFRNASAAIDRLGRTDRVMLIDMREARGRNEPEFDAALRRVRQNVERGMQCIVVLLRSSAGMLQMKRINEEDGTTRFLTMDEREGLEILQQWSRRKGF